MSYCPSCNGRFSEGAFCPKDGTPLLPEGETKSRSLIGQVIGHYRLTKLLGAGGMGEVYVGEHIHITKKVAIKLLHPEIGANKEALERFHREAVSASSIGHDNIVTIDDFGTMEDGRVYLSMEFLNGQSLAEAMQARGGLDPVRALSLMIQVSDGLAAAHSRGIVHRDMKPENVFLTRRSDGSELAKILDFGIAKVSGTDQNESLTRTGTVFGTPHYMSPEQALGQKLDHRADVYSVGVMLFEIFTGQVPFKAESFMGILSQHITKAVPVPSTVTPGRAIPREMEEIILKAMAKEPDKRFSTMKEVGDALKKVQDDLLRTAAGLASRGQTLAFGSQAGPMSASAVAAAAGISPARLPTADDMTAPEAARLGAQATVAAVTPPGGQPAATPEVVVGYQPTVASVPMQAPIGPGSTSEAVIPKTMIAATSQVAGAPQVAGPAFTPAPAVSGAPRSTPSAKQSKKGLMIGLIAGVVVLLGGGALAAVLFWDKIVGGGPEVSTGSGSGSGIGSAVGAGSGTAAGTGSGGTVVALAPKADAGKQGADPQTVEHVEQGDKSEKGEPKSKGKHGTATTEPKAEPKPEPKAEPKPEPKAEPKPEPKAEPKPEPKAEPKPEPKPKHEPKPEPKEEPCCDVVVVSSPPGASVLRNGRKVGTTPYSIKLERGESIDLVLAKGGWADKAVTVRGTKNGNQSVALKKQRIGGPPDGIPGSGGDGIPGSDPFK